MIHSYDPNEQNGWQKHCTSVLEHCIGLGSKGAAEWASRLAKLSSQGRVIIADLRTSADLTGYSFRRCYLIRVDYDSANLANVDFRQAIIRNTSFLYANLEHAKFGQAAIGRECKMLHTSAPSGLDFAIQRGEHPENLDPYLLDLAQTSWTVEDFKRNVRGPFSRAIYAATDYGRSVPRLFGASLIVVMLYGLAFATSLPSDTQPINAIIQGTKLSTLYFLSMDNAYGGDLDMYVWLGISEAALGLVAVAILIATLARRFTAIR